MSTGIDRLKRDIATAAGAAVEQFQVADVAEVVRMIDRLTRDLTTARANIEDLKRGCRDRERALAESRRQFAALEKIHMSILPDAGKNAADADRLEKELAAALDRERALRAVLTDRTWMDTIEHDAESVCMCDPSIGHTCDRCYIAMFVHARDRALAAGKEQK